MEITKMHDISVLHLFGEVSFLEMDHIEKILASLKKTNNNKVLIDMSSVDHVHYAVIKKLVENVMHFRRNQGDIKLVSSNSNTKDIIKFTGADQYLEDYASISEAMLSFLGHAEQNEALYQ
ncbi:MAG TPA: STAS domain-containing protein [bacterium]|nr:STAS domain-containing protein [bacterium]